MKIDPRLFNQIARDERISSGAFRVWHILFGMTGRNKNCWPSIRTIAKLIHADKSSVQKWLLELEAACYLQVERGNKHRSNKYVITGIVSEKNGHSVPKIGTIGVRNKPTQLNSLTKYNNQSGRHAQGAVPPTRHNGNGKMRSVAELVSEMRTAMKSPL